MVSENEIELKLMLKVENIPLIRAWIATHQVIEPQKIGLGNTYFDTPERYFAQHQMGLRIRRQQSLRELTLKMKGEIVGGLHIRPEYHLQLEDDFPDFARLVELYQLPIRNSCEISARLEMVFSTDFERESGLIQFGKSVIEVALDIGEIKNPYGEESICEIEFELKQGKVSDLFDFIMRLPVTDGIWLSSLSKAYRGYLVGQPKKIQAEIDRLLAIDWRTLAEEKQYQYLQNLADFARLQPDNLVLLARLQELDSNVTVPQTDLYSAVYLQQNLAILKALYTQFT